MPDTRCEFTRENSNISTIGILSKDAHESLMASLMSVLHNCLEHSRRPEFVVFDDSRNSDTRVMTRESLSLMTGRFNVNISYAGLEEKVRFAEAVISAGGFDPDVVRFALIDSQDCRNSTGANRNALLLHTAGELFLSLDDDIDCRVAESPGRQEGIALNSTGNTQQFYFFEDRESALGSVTFLDADLPGIHEELLGRGVSEAVTQPVSSRIEDVWFRASGRGGRVLVTQNGVVGDSGMSAPSWLWLQGESRSRLVASESVYRMAHQSREIVRVAERATITTDPWCMATVLGGDHRELLPPFFPVLRNQDGVFGLCLRACFPDGYLGHLPYAIVHAPRGSREQPDKWRRANGIDMWNVVLLCVTSLGQPAGETDEQRLRALGRHIEQIGSLPQAEFERFVETQLLNQGRAIISALESAEQHHGANPRYWADDVEEYIARLRQAMSEKDYSLPRDLVAIFGIERARKLLKDMIRKFGRMFQCWPDLVKTARDLKAKGDTLARRIG